MSEVLIIDDEERTQATVRRLKLIHHLKVDVVDHPTLALQAVRDKQYKVIIFDIMMSLEEEDKSLETDEVKNQYGLLTGAILLKKIWEDDTIPKEFKAIFFSARDKTKINPDLDKLGLKEGEHYQKYFQKPINTSLLFQEIQKHL